MADTQSNPAATYDVLGWWRNYLEQTVKSWSQIMSTAQPQPKATPEEELRGKAMGLYTSSLHTWRQLLDLAFANYESLLNLTLQGRVPGAAVGTETAAVESWRQMADQAMGAYTSFLSSMAQNMPVPSLGALPPAVSDEQATKALRSSIDQTIEQWSQRLEEAVNSESFAQNIGQYLDRMLNQAGVTQRYLDGATERNWRMLNLPSRQQVTRLAEQLKVVELRIEELQDKLDAALARDKASQEAAPEPSAPPTSASRRRRES